MSLEELFERIYAASPAPVVAAVHGLPEHREIAEHRAAAQEVINRWVEVLGLPEPTDIYDLAGPRPFHIRRILSDGRIELVLAIPEGKLAAVDAKGRLVELHDRPLVRGAIRVRREDEP